MNRTIANSGEVFVDHTVDHMEAKDRPDGACVDMDGYVWNAIFAGRRVVRYAPKAVSTPSSTCR
jgi:sugar lactone lactonase YvrE